jgi:hypothetical protein
MAAQFVTTIPKVKFVALPINGLRKNNLELANFV